MNPDFAYGYYCLAQVRYRQERYDDAWKAVHRAQDLGYGVPKGFLEKLRAASPEPEKPPEPAREEPED